MKFSFLEYIEDYIRSAEERPSMFSSWSLEIGLCGVIAAWEASIKENTEVELWRQLWKEECRARGIDLRKETLSGSLSFFALSPNQEQLRYDQVKNGMSRVFVKLYGEVRICGNTQAEYITRLACRCLNGYDAQLDPNRFEFFVLELLSASERLAQNDMRSNQVTKFWHSEIYKLHQRSYLSLSDIRGVAEAMLVYRDDEQTRARVLEGMKNVSRIFRQLLPNKE